MRIAASFLLGLLLGIGVPQLFVMESANALFSAASIFRDVKGGEYYDESVLDMVRKGIVKGYDDGRFGPNDPVTRGQVAVMLKRYHHNVVGPLQRKVEYLMKHLNLGECGDGVLRKQHGEQCDDGNVVDGDGCSAECLTEERPLSLELPPDSIPVPVPHPTPTPPPSPRTSVSCDEEEQRLADTIRSHRACRTDDDCRLLIRPCSPFLTCGQAVNTGGLGAVKEAIGKFAKACPEEHHTCAKCPERDVICSEGFCRVYPPIVCTEEARVCPDGSSVSRNSDLECDFDPCPVEEVEEGAD